MEKKHQCSPVNPFITGCAHHPTNKYGYSKNMDWTDGSLNEASIDWWVSGW
jgi:hypothetical protein